MSVFKVHKDKNYTVMSNYHLNEKDMSLKAIGLLSIMLSLPKDWDYSIGGLCSIRKENETAITTALNELKRFGYLRIDKVLPNNSSNGRIEYIYNIFEKPQNQKIEKQGVENLPLENQVQLNTNNIDTNNKKENKKESVDASTTYTAEELENWFNTTYSIYPRKVSRIRAKDFYERKIRGLCRYEAKNKANKIYVLLKRQIEVWANENDRQGRKIEHIPYFSSWLSANIDDSPNFKKGKR